MLATAARRQGEWQTCPSRLCFADREKVEILTTKRGGPSRDWLNTNLGLVRTQRARSKIRYWFKRQAREQNILQGKDILDKEMDRLGIEDVNLDNLSHQFGFRSIEEMDEAIGCGDMALGRISNYLMLQEEDEEGHQFSTRPLTEPERQDSESITVVGLKGILTTIAAAATRCQGMGLWICDPRTRRNYSSFGLP